MTKRLRYGPNIIQLLLNKLTFTFFFKEQDCFLFLPVGVYLLKATRLTDWLLKLVVLFFSVFNFFFFFFFFFFCFLFFLMDHSKGVCSLPRWECEAKRRGKKKTATRPVYSLCNISLTHSFHYYAFIKN